MKYPVHPPTKPEPREDDARYLGDHRGFLRDHEQWSRAYASWGKETCHCGRGYFCRAHGQWVPGDEVRNAPSRVPSKHKQSPDTCHHSCPVCELGLKPGHTCQGCGLQFPGGKSFASSTEGPQLPGSTSQGFSEGHSFSPGDQQGSSLATSSPYSQYGSKRSGAREASEDAFTTQTGGQDSLWYTSYNHQEPSYGSSSIARPSQGASLHGTSLMGPTAVPGRLNHGGSYSQQQPVGSFGTQTGDQKDVNARAWTIDHGTSGRQETWQERPSQSSGQGYGYETDAPDGKTKSVWPGPGSLGTSFSPQPQATETR